MKSTNRYIFFTVLLFMIHGIIFRIYGFEGNKTYYNTSWKTLRFETAYTNRLNSPTSFSSRAHTRRKGTIILDKKDCRGIYIVDGDQTIFIGDTDEQDVNMGVVVFSLARSVTIAFP